jgi:hypothetical protein
MIVIVMVAAAASHLVLILGDDGAELVEADVDLVEGQVGERRVDPVAGADGAQVAAGQVAMRVDPKCHLDLGEAELAGARRVERVEGLAQPDQLVTDLERNFSLAQCFFEIKTVYLFSFTLKDSSSTSHNKLNC